MFGGESPVDLEGVWRVLTDVGSDQVAGRWSGRGRKRAVFSLMCVAALAVGVACTNGDTEPNQVENSADRQSLGRGDVPSEVREDLEHVFTDAGVVGGFVLYEVSSRSATVVGPEQVRERAEPEATFMLAHTLIALQTDVVDDVDETIDPKGDDADRGADMSLREALSSSSDPVYQELARRVGPEALATWVDRFEYGNRSVGGPDEVDSFWSKGPLQVSAMEQAEFLARLAGAELPVDTEHQLAVQEMALYEQGENHSLYAQDGWAREGEPEAGWWVGWVNGEQGLHTFALHLEIEEEPQAELRETLSRELLTELEALPD